MTAKKKSVDTIALELACKAITNRDFTYCSEVCKQDYCTPNVEDGCINGMARYFRAQARKQRGIKK
jgi:hypothetical protein